MDNSPRLGTEVESYGQVIINFNDNANGELVLSPLSPRVREGVTEDFLFVTRYGGAFGEVNYIYVSRHTLGIVIWSSFSCKYAFTFNLTLLSSYTYFQVRECTNIAFCCMIY